MIRTPAVAGRFYPADPAVLCRDIRKYAAADEAASPAIACVVPHAGYMYSGHVAGAVYSRMRIPGRAILLGPRHFPRGAAMAICPQGSWRTPLGDAPVDAPLAAALARACPCLREDPVAHEREHSLEVQLPFLQHLAPGASFVPVVLAASRYEQLEDLGRAIAQVASAQPEPVLLVASSDMNHYESDSITRAKDRRAIERILALDPRGLYDVVRSEEISMCGCDAVVAALIAARALGACAAELIRYATSADATGDSEEVVGYAGLVVR